MNLLKKIIHFFKERREKKKREKLYRKKLEELRKRDPFIYKNK